MKKKHAPGYLPQGYKDRYQRLIVDLDAEKAYAGWHDEHWDGKVDATARPHTIFAGFRVPLLHRKRRSFREMVRPGESLVEGMARAMRRASKVEKRRLMDTTHRAVFAVPAVMEEPDAESS